jgi:DNA topoisomerase-1
LQPLSGCSTRPPSVWATRNTPIENGSFGLTTLRNQHVDISGSKIYFHFRGKSGKEHTVSVQNRQLARIVKRCQDLPGYELFQYIDDNGQRSTIESADVNDYLRQVSGRDFTAKDFRTWAGTVFAMDALQNLGEAENQTQAKKKVGQAIEVAAEHLGNTKTICRKCYVHPAVVDAYLEGTLLTSLSQQHDESASDASGLRPEETHVLQFLKQQAEGLQELNR